MSRSEENPASKQVCDTEHAATAGPRSFARIEPFDPKISGNFEIARHVGQYIAHWDRPEFVPARDATHLRDEDHVVGLTLDGLARAYPLWITDYYHAVNDVLGDTPIVFVTCERCQSGAAFVRDPRERFSSAGMFNATLLTVDRGGPIGHVASQWLHYEGVAIAGPRTGEFLDWIPTVHLTWAEWRALHPETDVMLPPSDPHHRDARHGHGREEYFERPGMDPSLVSTITGSLDERYPEHRVVLGLNVEAGCRAYPLAEVKKAGGVVNDVLGGTRIVVLSGPEDSSVGMGAFVAEAGGRTLTFVREGDEEIGRGIRDRETGSGWTVEGRAHSGPLRGTRLAPVRWNNTRWHAWLYAHRSTELFRAPPSNQPRRTESDSWPAPALESLREAGFRFQRTVYSLSLPNEVEAGLRLSREADRIHLYRFRSDEAAADYVQWDGARSCMPIGARWERRPCLRLGRYVIESDPAVQYADPAQIVRLPDQQIDWVDLLEDADWRARAKARFVPDHDSGPVGDSEVLGPFTTLVSTLRKRRYDVVEVAFLPPSQLVVGSVNAIAATIQGDRLLLYKCVDAPTAGAVADGMEHAFSFGRFVCRSTPRVMYVDPVYEIGELPESDVTHSRLVERPGFRRVLESALGAEP